MLRSTFQIPCFRLAIRAAVIVLPALAGCGDSGAPNPGAESPAEVTADVASAGAVDSAAAEAVAPAAPQESATAPEVDLDAMEHSPDGLYTLDLQVGTGEEAQRGQLATVHYTGWLLDGAQFDSSRRGRPFQFELGAGQVISGWDEGVVGMRVGGRRRLVIPPELGYGAMGAGGGVIPPNATLVFDVELLSLD